MYVCTQGANQAAAAAKLGQLTFFVGAVGSDSYAAPLRQALGDAGVRLDHLAAVPGPSGTAVILLQDGGACEAAHACVGSCLDCLRWPSGQLKSPTTQPC